MGRFWVRRNRSRSFVTENAPQDDGQKRLLGWGEGSRLQIANGPVLQVSLLGETDDRFAIARVSVQRLHWFYDEGEAPSDSRGGFPALQNFRQPIWEGPCGTATSRMNTQRLPPAQPATTHSAAPAASTFNSAPASSAPVRSSAPAAKSLATLGPGLTVKGQISGDEDLQVEGKVEGPISLKGQRLTVGSAGEIVSDVHAREVIVYGKVRGNLFAEDRVEVKKDGSVIGNITGGRVLIEDGRVLEGPDRNSAQ